MAKPASKSQLKDYCLRKLGHPVINIELADEQIDDRIDEAVELFQERHYDATEEKWVYYQLSQEDIDRGYIEVPQEYLHVIEIIPAATISSRSGDMFSFQYQIMTSELNSWQPFDSIDYFMKMSSIDEVRNLIDADPRFKFIRHKNQIKIYQNYTAGYGLIIHVFEIVDLDNIWNDKWLKEYSTALIKLQWGENISKYNEVQLLGGITISGDRIISEAKEDIQRLREQLDTEHSEPTGFIFG